MKLKGIVAAAGIAALLSGGVLVGFANAAAPVTPAPNDTVQVTPTQIATTPGAPAPIATTPRPGPARVAPRGGREIRVRPAGAPQTGGGGLSYLVSTWG